MPYIEDSPDIVVRLRHAASQENCDGQPWDDMEEAANLIVMLKVELEAEKIHARNLYRLLDLARNWVQDSAVRVEITKVCPPKKRTE